MSSRALLEKLSELADQHKRELANAISELKAENSRLLEDRAKLNEELVALRKASSLGEQDGWDSPSSLVVLPGSLIEDNDIEVLKLPEVKVDTRKHPIPPLKTVQAHAQLVPPHLNKHSPREPTSEKSPRPNRPLFPNSDELKTQVRQAVAGKPTYKVADLYHETGFFQMIAKSALFENITFVVIFAATIWIAVDTDHNPADTLVEADALFVLVANFFCFYFTSELIIRFGAFKLKRDCVKDKSFICDAILVLQDVLETWCLTIYVALADTGQSSPANLGIFRVIRMAKLFRMGRAVRLMRALPEIAILVKGIGIATRSVFFTLFLLMLIIYVFAVVFRQITDGTAIGEQYFENVPHAINSLLLDGVLPDNAQIVNDLAGAQWYLWPLIMFFILLASLTVMNMLVGVLVEVVGAVAEAEKEGLAVSDMREHLVQVMNKLDFDQSGCISKTEFDRILVQPEAAKILSDVGVDVVGLVDLSDFIFEDFGAGDGELDLEEFMNVILDLRVTNTAKVKDVVMLQKLMKRDMRTFYDHIIKNMIALVTGQDVVQTKERLKEFTTPDGVRHRVTAFGKDTTPLACP